MQTLSTCLTERQQGKRAGVLGLGLLILLLHSDQRHCNLLEQTLYVVAGFCRRLHKHDVELGRFRVGLLKSDLSVYSQ